MEEQVRMRDFENEGHGDGRGGGFRGGGGGGFRGGGGGGFRGGGGGGGFQRDFGPREMHKAVCADCGAECEVPFKPIEGKPVYCKNCFMKRKPQR